MKLLGMKGLRSRIYQYYENARGEDLVPAKLNGLTPRECVLHAADDAGLAVIKKKAFLG